VTWLQLFGVIVFGVLLHQGRVGGSSASSGTSIFNGSAGALQLCIGASMAAFLLAGNRPSIKPRRRLPSPYMAPAVKYPHSRAAPCRPAGLMRLWLTLEVGSAVCAGVFVGLQLADQVSSVLSQWRRCVAATEAAVTGLWAVLLLAAFGWAATEWGRMAQLPAGWTTQNKNAGNSALAFLFFSFLAWVRTAPAFLHS